MLKNLVVAAITLGVLVACGYSGALYLPQNADKQAGATSKNQFAPTSLVQLESANESTPSNQVRRKSLLPATILPESTNSVESGFKTN